MQYKVVDAMTSGGLQKKINKFINQNEQLDVKDVSIAASFGTVYALIAYEEK